jgi:two-component system LytT family response regulator
MIPLKVEDIAYFYLKHGVIKAITHEKKKFIVEHSLEHLDNELNPEEFYRANRQYIVSRRSIKAVELFFKRKLILRLIPVTEDDVLISKTKVTEFKKWFEA